MRLRHAQYRGGFPSLSPALPGSSIDAKNGKNRDQENHCKTHKSMLACINKNLPEMTFNTFMAEHDLWLSDSIPSRTIICHEGKNEGNQSVLMHFDDIRDAIAISLEAVRSSGKKITYSNAISTSHYITRDKAEISTPALSSKIDMAFDSAPLLVRFDRSLMYTAVDPDYCRFDPAEVQFACAPMSKGIFGSILAEEGHGQELCLSSGAIMVTMKWQLIDSSAVDFDSAECVAEALRQLMETFGPVLAVSPVQREKKSGKTFKFFAEYYRTQDAKKFLKGFPVSDLSKRIQAQDVSIAAESVNLFNVDREALFFATIIDDSKSTSSTDSFSTAHSRRNSASSSIDGTESINKRIPHSIIEISSCIGNEPTDAFEIDLAEIEFGREKRTTCMIRNIPNKYTQQMVIDMVNETHHGCYDFLYLRMDFRNRCNVGYAFINFIDPRHILTFARRVCGRRWARFNSDKVCHLTFARIQGLSALIDKFRHSKVMFEHPAYRPKLFYSSGPRSGEEAPFPN